MTTQEYIDSFKERFGHEYTKDGQLIRDMNDFELLDRSLKRWPGDRAKLDETDLEMYYSMYDPKRKPPAAPPKTRVQEAVDDIMVGIPQVFKDRGAKIKEAQGANQSGFSKAFQTVGHIAGGIGDVVMEGVDAADELITGGAGGDAMNKLAEMVGGTETAQGIIENYEQFKAENPELAGNIEATIDIGGLIAGGGIGAVGAKTATKVAKQVGKGVIERGGAMVDDVVEMAAPNLTKEAMDVAVIGPQGKKQTISALERSGRPGGYAPDDSFLGRITGNEKYVPTPRDVEIAEAVTGIVRKNDPPSKNIAALNNKIAEKSETVIRPALKAYPAPFNLATYSKRLKDVEMPDFIKADATLEKTYEMVRNRFVEVVKKHPKTKEGLWDARKEIDDVIEQQFGAAGFNPDKYSALQKAVLDMRRATNDFIAEDVPDDVFKKEMRTLSNMYSARHNIALDNYALQNKDMFTRWTKNNPKQWAALKAAGLAGSVGGGAMLLLPD